MARFNRQTWDRQPPHEWPLKPSVVVAFTPGGGQFDSAHGMPCDLATSTQYDIGSGACGEWRAANWYGGRRSASRGVAPSSTPICALTTVGSVGTGVLLEITTAAGTAAYWCLGIDASAGVISGKCRAASGTFYTITGPTITGTSVAIACVTWEPGIGISLSVDGVDYGTTAFSDAALYRDGGCLNEGLHINARHYVSAMLAPEWIPLRTELSTNPWQIFEPRRVLVPAAAAAGGGTGSLAQTLAALTSSATGTLPIVGTAAPTLAALTSSATGTLPIVGTAAPTLAVLTSSATGTLPIVGTAAPTLAALTSAATGRLAIVGTAAPTLAALTVSATGTAVEGPTGTLSATLAALAASAAGVLPIVGQASATLGALTSAATGRVAIAAQLGITLGDLVVAATGSGASLDPIVGVCEVTLGALTVAATAAEHQTTTPAERTLQILAESRALRIAAETRALQIDAESRTLRIRPS